MRLICNPGSTQWQVQDLRPTDDGPRWVTVDSGSLWAMAHRWREMDGCISRQAVA